MLVLCGQVMGQGSSESQNRSWDFSVFVAGASGEEATNAFAEAQIFIAGIFVGKAVTGEVGRGWRRGRLELGADVVPVFLQFAPRRFHGIAFDPIILRWNSSLHRGRVAPFVELAGGAVHTGEDFPAAGTSTFNFIARGGGGILIATRRLQALELGCRWWHISNANLGVRNPEFNGIQVSLGWHWFR